MTTTYRQWLLWASVCLTGCGGDNDHRQFGVGVTGTAIVDWTIAQSKAPALCRQNNAATIFITVDTVGGAPVGDFSQDCEAFATSIELAPGNYVASAVLLDASGADRTTTVDISPFRIFGGDIQSLLIDFPANSFH